MKIYRVHIDGERDVRKLKTVLVDHSKNEGMKYSDNSFGANVQRKQVGLPSESEAIYIGLSRDGFSEVIVDNVFKPSDPYVAFFAGKEEDRSRKSMNRLSDKIYESFPRSYREVENR